MTFHRTPSGLSNLYLFASVDVIVFVEGGDSYSHTEVVDGKYSVESIDIKFWEKVFLHFANSLKLQFRAIGSKTTLTSIAGHIQSGTVTHVYVAMDRDHDWFTGALIYYPGVFYTFGYSWENDVCQDVVLEESFWALTQRARGSVDIRSEVERLRKQFSIDARRAVYVDVLLAQHGAAVLPRKNLSVLCTDTSGDPVFDKGRFSVLLRSARLANSRPIVRTSAISCETLRDCCGSLLGAFCYSMLRVLLKRFGRGRSYPSDIIRSVFIDKFAQYLAAERTTPLYGHYAGQFAMLS